MQFYEHPEDVANTVFDPSSETFGPIMAALQDGQYEVAIRLLGQIVSRGDGERLLDYGAMMERDDDDIRRTISPVGLHNALAVFLLDPKTRAVLAAIDPKGVEQARDALLLT